MRLHLRRQQVARRLHALDEVVGHHDMHLIVGSPLRHVAAHAVGDRRMSGGRRCALDGRAMAIQANAIVMRDGRLAARNVVRVMAGGALQLPLAPQKTLRLAQPVSRPQVFKRLVLPGRAVERQTEIAQRLPRHVPKRSSGPRAGSKPAI